MTENLRWARLVCYECQNSVCVRVNPQRGNVYTSQALSNLCEESPAAHLSTNCEPLCVSLRTAVASVRVVRVPAGPSRRRPFLHLAERGLPSGRDPGQGGVVDAAGTRARAHGPRVPEPREQTGNRVWFIVTFFRGQSFGRWDRRCNNAFHYTSDTDFPHAHSLHHAKCECQIQ